MVSQKRFSVGKIRDNMRLHVADVSVRSDSATSYLVLYKMVRAAVVVRRHALTEFIIWSERMFDVEDLTENQSYKKKYV
jgi:hypothetical protein